MNHPPAFGALTMGLFNKKTDPITERARKLEAEIAALESQIQKLSATPTDPSHVSPASRPGSSHTSSIRPNPAPVKPAAPEAPVFEKVNLQRVTAQPEVHAADKYNELGVRKFDLVGAWRRFLSHFTGPSAHNPQLISYLASGTIQGLRPLRYEKRVARNRFAALFTLLVLTLWGIAYVFFKRR